LLEHKKNKKSNLKYITVGVNLFCARHCAICFIYVNLYNPPTTLWDNTI
jgi:hypothetical protein